MTSRTLFENAKGALRSRRVLEAVRLYEAAEHCGFDSDSCAAGRWTAYMLLGDFERAWHESDAISARGNPDRNRYWDGKDLAGRSIIIRCLHGLGDTLQFIRYASLARKQARFVTIEAQPSLKVLLKEANIADEVITWGEPEPFWDQQIEVIELPRVFRTTVDSIPNEVPYFRLQNCNGVMKYDGSRPLRVGINWASSAYNPARSMCLEQMAVLSTIQNVVLYSLQAGPERQKLATCSALIEDVCDESECVLIAANTAASMDLVITVDTMLAHLAGALGRPVWTLLPYESDWRWMLDRDDSPWYPSMRLFRQPHPGAWLQVIEGVWHELAAIVRGEAALASAPLNGYKT
ncbi:MAG: hypothetical protein JO033_10270 [Acidobacteriaceae bacterium]|nr:hypothetical protein [Acidobacteriaceae bacterium]